MMKDHQDPLVPFPSESSADVLTDVLRDGARRMLATVIEREVELIPWLFLKGVSTGDFTDA